jgi:hypothetical protein
MTVHGRTKLLVVISALVGAWLGGVALYVRSDAVAAPSAPLGLHCRGVSPIEDWCGCTWGEVLFQGHAVPGAVVTLTFGSGVVTDTTQMTDLEPMPYFALTGQDLGACRGDVVTLTARFARQTAERTFRAWPDADGEQHVVLALPDRGVWSSWVTGGYTRTLALAGDTVWAGGPAGVISAGLTSGISVTYTLPWPDPSVRALAVGTDGHVWAAGPGGVAEFDGSAWHTHTVPLSHTLRALAVDPTTGAVWLGDGDAYEGNVAVYTGTWRTAGTFSAPVMALAVDGDGRAWAGTWGDGVHRQEGSGGWTNHRVKDGLASDTVLAAVPGAGAIWFGTWPYLSGQGPRGGIARYDLATGTWQVYTTAHGLPLDILLPEAPAPVYALARGPDGTIWAGTAQGVSFLADAPWWGNYTTTHGLRHGPVMAIVAGNEAVVAAPRAGLDILDRDAVVGSAPTAQIVAVDPLTLTLGMELTLSGEGEDGDEGGERIVAWDWSSDRQGPLCTAADCALPYDLFTPGAHTVTLRVQDDEGAWSAPAEARVVVEEARRVHLPLVVR